MHSFQTLLNHLSTIVRKQCRVPGAEADAPLTAIATNPNELREFLATKDALPRFADFKRKVIDKAVAEINDKTDMDLSWQPVKKGRAVSAIKFFIKTNKQMDLFPT